MNSATFIGRLGKDPEIRYFESGKSVTTFSMAVPGFKKNETHWVECEAWNKTGEAIAQYVKKGQQLGVVGSLKQEKWEDNATGANRSKLIVSVSSFTFVGSKDEQQPDKSGKPEFIPF